LPNFFIRRYTQFCNATCVCTNGRGTGEAVLQPRWLYTAQPRNEYYLTRHIESLLKASLYEDAEKVIKKAIKANPNNMALYVQRGLNYEAQGEMEKAEKTYADAIKKLPAERFAIQKLANAFSRAAKYSDAVSTYEKGGELLKDETMFAYNLGALYQQLNQEEKMVRNYILALREKPMRLGSVQSILSRYLDEDGYKRVQTAILLELQGAPDNETLTELLVWTYIQQKDFHCNCAARARTCHAPSQSTWKT